MTLPSAPPPPATDEARDVLVESINVTRIHVISPTRSVTQHGTVWNVWLNDLRAPFMDRAEAENYARQLAKQTGRPAWTRTDANHQWELLN